MLNSSANFWWMLCLPSSGPEGPSTQYFRCLVPTTLKCMAFGTRGLNSCVLGPSGWENACAGPLGKSFLFGRTRFLKLHKASSNFQRLSSSKRPPSYLHIDNRPPNGAIRDVLEVLCVVFVLMAVLSRAWSQVEPFQVEPSQVEPGRRTGFCKSESSETEIATCSLLDGFISATPGPQASTVAKAQVELSHGRPSFADIPSEPSATGAWDHWIDKCSCPYGALCV